MSNECTNYIAQIMFENKLLRSYGNEFQEIFYMIMKGHHKNFRDVKPHGSTGDLGCDGYLFGEGIFYQVYGPEYPEQTSAQSYAISKLKEDFYKLKGHIDNGKFEPIKEYHFVINTKNSRGISVKLCQKLDELHREHPEIQFGYLQTNDLIRKFLQLDDISKQQLLTPFIPTIKFEDVKYPILNNIIDYLMKNVNPLKCQYSLDFVEFERKIKFNNLSKDKAIQLEGASLFTYKLDDYLNSNPLDNIEDLLCQIYKQLYSKAVELYPNDPNEQFDYIVKNSYNNIPNDYNEEAQYIYNVLIIMGKFFESCDIFEKPDQENLDESAEK